LEKYLTTKQLQEWFQVNAVTIWRWRKAGLPFKKIGRNVRFDREEVRSWMEEYNTIN
jgi:excisionase family DNA binding protein